MKAALSIVDSLLNERGTGKGRNLNRVSTLALISMVWWNTRELPEQVTSVDKRLAKVEWHMGLTTAPGTNAVPNVGAVSAPATSMPGETRRAFTFLHKNQPEN